MTYSKLELNGKVAVVVGGTSGIGRAIAHGFAEAGADVIPTSRRAEQVEIAAREIEELGKRSLRITSDVSDRGVFGACAERSDRGIRQGRHPGQLGRTHEARAHDRLFRRRLEQHHRYKFDRNAAGVPGVWPAHA